MDTKLNIKEELALINVTYNDGGKLTHILDEIYAFIYTDNKMKIFKVGEEFRIIDEKYTLVFIGKDIIVLSRRTNVTFVDSIVISRHTFEILYKSSKLMLNTSELIYEECCAEVFGNNPIFDDRNIFDLQCNLIGTIPGGREFTISKTDNNDYYIASYKEDGEFYNTNCLLYYNKDWNVIELKWSSKEYDIECIGNGLLMFSEIKNFSNVHVYNIITKEIIK